MDDRLFEIVLANDHHMLFHILLDRHIHPYSLRQRRHEHIVATIKRDSRNFFERQLFKDMY